MLAVAFGACSGGGTSSPAPAVPSPGAATLNSNSQASTLPQTGSITGIITYPGGSGSVTATTSTTVPNSLPVLQSVARGSLAAVRTTKTTNTINVPIVYITVSSTAGAALNSAPGFTVNTPTTLTGTAYEAVWTGTEWMTVGSAGTISPLAAGGDQIQVGGGGAAIAIPAAGSAYFAVYTGGVVPAPSPTPTPVPTATPTQAATNLIADPGFENASGAYTPFAGSFTSGTGISNGPINATGWTQCSVLAVSSSIAYSGGINGSATGGAAPYVSATAPPVYASGPLASTTPAAVIASSGTSLTVGTSAPVPTVTAVSTHGGTYAAVFGQDFSNYNAGDYRYNGLCQNVTIPAGASPSLTAWVLSNGNDNYKYVQDLIGILDSSGTATTGTLTNILYMENVSSSSSPGETAFRQIPAAGSSISLASYAGQTVTLFVGMWTKDGNFAAASSYWFVDDLVLK